MAYVPGLLGGPDVEVVEYPRYYSSPTAADAVVSPFAGQHTSTGALPLPSYALPPTAAATRLAPAVAAAPAAAARPVAGGLLADDGGEDHGPLGGGYGTGGMASQIGWSPGEKVDWSLSDSRLGGLLGSPHALGDINYAGLDKDRVAEAHKDAVMGQNQGLLGSIGSSVKSFVADPEKALDAVWADPNSLVKALSLVPGLGPLGMVAGAFGSLNKGLQAEQAAKAAMGVKGFATGRIDGMPYTIGQDAWGRHITGTVPDWFTVDMHDRMVEEQRQADLAAVGAGPTDYGTTGWSGTALGLGPADFADWGAAAGPMDWDEGDIEDYGPADAADENPGWGDPGGDWDGGEDDEEGGYDDTSEDAEGDE